MRQSPHTPESQSTNSTGTPTESAEVERGFDDDPPAGRTLVLLLVVGAWAVITVGIAFERAEVTGGYQTLSLVVALLVSRYFGLPARALTGAR